MLRIIGPPVKKGTSWLYPCSDGKDRNIQQMANIVGIDHSTMRARLHRNGWDHARVLQGNTARKKPKSKKKPTRIVEKPFLAKTPHGNELNIKCDNGEVYNGAELAVIVGCSESHIGVRIRRLGWDHPDVINFGKKPKASFKEIMQPSPYKTIITGDLAHLSDTHNSNGVRVYEDNGEPVREIMPERPANITTAKLSEDQVLRIRALLKSIPHGRKKEAQVRLAEKYSVSVYTIENIRLRRNMAWI